MYNMTNTSKKTKPFPGTKGQVLQYISIDTNRKIKSSAFNALFESWKSVGINLQSYFVQPFKDKTAMD